MVETPSIDAIRGALAPVEALRGEQSQLETWVRDSFAALDSLHGELAEWQRDLTREQAELDQREAALKEGGSRADSEAVARLEAELSKAREVTQQVEDENSEQLQAIDELDRQLAVALAELRILRKHHEELTATLATERERGAEEHRHWTSELKELRRLMERQSAMLDRLCSEQLASEGAAALADDASGTPLPDSGEVTSRAAELRRRANSRRVQRHPS